MHSNNLGGASRIFDNELAAARHATVFGKCTAIPVATIAMADYGPTTDTPGKGQPPKFIAWHIDGTVLQTIARNIARNPW